MNRSLPLLALAATLACRPEAKVDGTAPTPSPTDSGDSGAPTGDGPTTAVLGTVSEDYAVGALATVDLLDWSVTDQIVDTPGDLALTATEANVIQLNRYGYDTVQVYAPGRWQTPTAEWALPDLANPHAAVDCAGELFITQYGLDRVAVHDPASGLLTGTVDLSTWDDGDGTPEASRMVRAANGHLYVGLHNLDRTTDWGSVGGAVLELDCAARAVTRDWSFRDADIYANPGRPDRLLIHEDGVGVHRLDTETGNTELVLATADLGIAIDGLAAFDDQAVAITVDPDGSYAIGCIDLDEGTWIPGRSVDNYLVGITGDGEGDAWISARTHWTNPAASNGVLVWDIATCTERTERPIETVLAPMTITFY